VMLLVVQPSHEGDTACRYGPAIYRQKIKFVLSASLCLGVAMGFVLRWLAPMGK